MKEKSPQIGILRADANRMATSHGGNVTRRMGNTQTETDGLIYMDINEGTLAGSVPDGVYAIQDTCYLIVTLS